MSNRQTPWRSPDYKGKLKTTPLLPCQPGFVPPSPNERKEAWYTALADGEIDIDMFNKFINKI